MAASDLSVVLLQLLERYPGDSALVESLFMENGTFRTVCEDLALAKRTLQKLETFRKQGELTKIAEYRELVSELENEVADVLEHAKKPK